MSAITNRNLATQWGCSPRHASKVRGLKAHTVVTKERPVYEKGKPSGVTRVEGSAVGRPRNVKCAAECKCPLAQSRSAK